MGTCIGPSKSQKQTIYKVKIPEVPDVIDPEIINEELISKINHLNVFGIASKNYFDQNTQKSQGKEHNLSQTTGLFSPQKLSFQFKQHQLRQTKIIEIKQKYTQCIELYALHQIDKASQLASYLLLQIQQLEIDNRMEMMKQLVKIRNQHIKVNNFQKQVSNTGWEFKGQNKGIRVSSRRETDTVAVLIQAQINIPVEILAAVLTEVDLFYKFVPFMESSKQLKICARNAKIGHCINNLPVISKRQAFFFGIGYDRLQHNGSIFIYTQSLLQNQQLMKQHDFYPQTTKGAVQLDYKYLIFQYTPRDTQSGLVRLAINVDMKLPYVPMFIMDPVTRDFGFDFFKNMVKISKNFQNSEWKSRVAKRPDLFNFFKNRVEEYVQNK